jgi:hypothetical protein
MLKARGHYHPKAKRYPVVCQNKLLVKRSRDPECDAARALLAQGALDKLYLSYQARRSRRGSDEGAGPLSVREAHHRALDSELASLSGWTPPLGWLGLAPLSLRKRSKSEVPGRWVCLRHGALVLGIKPYRS